jgi:hypothetical protein
VQQHLHVGLIPDALPPGEISGRFDIGDRQADCDVLGLASITRQPLRDTAAQTPEIGNRTPVDAALTELGARQVEELMARIVYGLPA